MSKRKTGGSTSVSLPIFVRDTTSTTGAGLAGVTHASSGLVFEYRRAGQSSWTSVTPVSKTLGTYTSGGIVADGSLDGAYEIDPPNAAVASGVPFVVIRIRGVANMLPVLIEYEIDAVNYQDADGFGLSRIDAAVTSRMASYTQPAGFLAATFPATVASTTNITAASGVTLAASQPGVTIPTVTSVTNGVTVSTNNDKGGYSLTQSFPSNFATLSIDSSGRVLLQPTQTGVTIPNVTAVELVDELGPGALNANDLITDIGVVVWQQLTTATWPTDSFGKQVLIGSSTQRSVAVTGSSHVAADVHEFQPGVITESGFATGALSARVLAADAATEIATAVGTLQVLTRLDSMIESDGAGQFRFDTIALENAPSGGGPGGSTDWTSNERSAIRSILGFNSSGSVVDPSVGILDEIRDGLGGSSTINVYPVSASTPERVAGTTLTFYRDESRAVSVVTDFTLTSLTLRFVVEDNDGNDVLVIENAAITKSSQTFTVSITTPVTANLGNYRWSMRDITSGNSVIAFGVLTVQEAASKDA